MDIFETYCIEQIEDGYFLAYLAQNPSCYAYGETEEEACKELSNITCEQGIDLYALTEWC